MRAMNSDGRQALKLRPGGTKDDSFPCSRQQMIRPKHMLGSLYMGELSSQLIVICVNPFSCDKLLPFSAQIDVLSCCGCRAGPRACSWTQRQMFSPCPPLRYTDWSSSTSTCTCQRGQTPRSRCLVDHRPPTETCFVVGFCPQNNTVKLAMKERIKSLKSLVDVTVIKPFLTWTLRRETFVDKVVKPEAKPSFSVAVGTLNKQVSDGKLSQLELGKPSCSSHVNKPETMV